MDPNVLIAAVIAPRGTSARVFGAWLEGGLEIVVSAKLSDELERVLKRPRFRKYVTVEEVGAYVDLFRKLSTTVEYPELPEPLSRDPGDVDLKTLAQAVNADYVVSGDRHLLEAQSITPPVISPAILARDGC